MQNATILLKLLATLLENLINLCKINGKSILIYMTSFWKSQKTLLDPPLKNKRIAGKKNLIKNSQAVKKGAAPIKAMVKKDVKSKVAAKKWL